MMDLIGNHYIWWFHKALPFSLWCEEQSTKLCSLTGSISSNWCRVMLSRTVYGTKLNRSCLVRFVQSDSRSVVKNSNDDQNSNVLVFTTGELSIIIYDLMYMGVNRITVNAVIRNVPVADHKRVQSNGLFSQHGSVMTSMHKVYYHVHEKVHVCLMQHDKI